MAISVNRIEPLVQDFCIYFELGLLVQWRWRFKFLFGKGHYTNYLRQFVLGLDKSLLFIQFLALATIWFSGAEKVVQL